MWWKIDPLGARGLRRAVGTTCGASTQGALRGIRGMRQVAGGDISEGFLSQHLKSWRTPRSENPSEIGCVGMFLIEQPLDGLG